MALTDFFIKGFNNIFRGKDQYTQTNFQTFGQLYNLSKGEYKIDTSVNGLHEIATTTAHLSAVMTKKANMLANGRWCEYRMERGEKVKVENSEIVRALENPNPLQNGNELLRQISWSYDVYGNCFINLNRLSSPIPTSMYVLPVADLQFKYSGKLYTQVALDDIIEKIWIDTESGYQYFEIKNLIHFKTANPNSPLLGISPIEELKLPIANLRAALGFRNRIINNDAALGILSGAATQDMSVGLNEKDQKRIQSAYKSKFGMQQGKADIIMSETPVTWTSMSYPTKDLMLFEEVDQDFKIIIDHYGLNDNIFSREKASTFTNYDQGVKSAYQDCIIPFSEDIALGFTKSLGLDGLNRWLEIDYSHLEIMKEDEKAKTENLKRTAESVAILRANGYEDVADSIVENL